MNILVVEDDPFVADDLKDKLEQLHYRVIGIAESVDAAIGIIGTHKPDLALVDIELKGERTGIELGTELQKLEIPFIYLSSIQDMHTYYKAKDTGPLKNLAKPIDTVNLRNALLDIRQQNPIPSPKDKLLFITDKDGIRKRIDPDQIVYLDADRSYCDLFLANEERITLSYAMGNVARKLNHPDLIQISRSHFVNRKHIQQIRGNEVKLIVGPYLRISDKYKDEFNDLVNYL